MKSYERIVDSHRDEAILISRRPCDGGEQLTPAFWACRPTSDLRDAPQAADCTDDSGSPSSSERSLCDACGLELIEPRQSAVAAFASSTTTPAACTRQRSLDALAQVDLWRVAELGAGARDVEGAALREEVHPPAIDRRLDAERRADASRRPRRRARTARRADAAFGGGTCASSAIIAARSFSTGTSAPARM